MIFTNYITPNIWVEKIAIFRLFLLEIVENHLERVLPVKHARLYYSIILGQRVSWSNQFQNYQELIGTQHIFAASGYNLSVVLMVIAIVTPKYINAKLKTFLYFSSCVIYTWLVGWQASLVRALGMVGYMLIAKEVKRRTYQPIYGLGVVFFLLIFFIPSLLQSLSFQLSVSATLGITLFYRFFSSKPSALAWVETDYRAPKFGLKILDLLKENLGITISAQIFTTSIIMMYFNTFTWYSFLANLCLLWLVPIIFVLGTLIIPTTLILTYTPIKNVASFVCGIILYPPAELFIKLVELLGKSAPQPLEIAWLTPGILIGWWSIAVIAWVLLSKKLH